MREKFRTLVEEYLTRKIGVEIKCCLMFFMLLCFYAGYRLIGGFQEASGILLARYEKQIELYTRAIEQILKKPVAERYLFFFDGAHILKL